MLGQGKKQNGWEGRKVQRRILKNLIIQNKQFSRIFSSLSSASQVFAQTQRDGNRRELYPPPRSLGKARARVTKANIMTIAIEHAEREPKTV